MKNYIILFFLFLQLNILCSQTNGISSQNTENNNDLVDYYTCLLFKYALTDENLDSFNCHNNYDVECIKTFFDNNDKIIKLVNRVQKIKTNNNFKNIDANELESILNDSLNSFIVNLKTINNKKFNSNINSSDISSKLKSDLNAFINNINKTNQINKSKDNIDNIDNIDNGEYQEHNKKINTYQSSYWFSIIVFVILLMLLAITLLFIKDKRKNNYLDEIDNNIKEINKTIKNIKNEIYNIKPNDNSNNNNNNWSIDIKIKELESAVNQLKTGFFNLSIKTEPINETTNEPSNKHPQLNYDLNKDTAVKTIYYFSTPNNDGSFLDANKSLKFESSDLSKYFKFEIDNNNSNVAKVTIIEESTTQIHILKNYREYLDSVCYYTNTFSQIYTRIKTIQSGIAELSGEKWVIKDTKKIQIKFE